MVVHHLSIVGMVIYHRQSLDNCKRKEQEQAPHCMGTVQCAASKHMASSSSYARPKLGPNPPLLCLNQLYAVSMWNIKLYYSIGVRVTLEELVPVCISVALIGRIPEGGRIRLDHGSRRQSRWIADFPWSRRGSLLEISHFPPHYYTSYLKDGAQIPIRRNLCSSPNPKFLLELTKLYKKGVTTPREKNSVNNWDCPTIWAQWHWLPLPS